MLVSNHNNKKKVTANILAAGFTAAYTIMLLPNSKETLDFIIYGLKIELYAPTRAVVFLGAIFFGIVTGGTIIANKLKGKQNAGDGME